MLSPEKKAVLPDQEEKKEAVLPDGAQKLKQNKQLWGRYIFCGLFSWAVI